MSTTTTQVTDDERSRRHPVPRAMDDTEAVEPRRRQDGDPSASVGGHRRDLGLAVGLAVVSVVIRLPFQSAFLVNFDSVNYAFGIEGFDLERHEPHPPGYLGYVLLARAVDVVVGDANRSLTLLSVVAAGVATALVFLLARRFASRRSAVVVTALFALAPLTWYYGIVGLGYLPGAAVALGIVWACHHARFDRSVRHAYVAALLLAALGALRQTDIVLFAPLLWFATAPLATRTRLRIAGLVVAASTLWLVPLLWLSGGPFTYVELSRDLAVLAGGRTSVFGLDPGGLARNVRLVTSGLVLGLFAAIPLLVLTARRGLFARDELRFVLWWVVPPSAVFLLVHTGQLGYVLPVLPAAHLLMARGLDRRRAERDEPQRRPRLLPAVALVAILVVDVIGFTVVPGLVLDAARSSPLQVPVVGEVSMPAVTEVRPVDVESNDDHWRALLDRAGRTDPDRTALLALPNTSVSFRHLAFYLREHAVYAVGIGRNGRFGHLFSARHGETDYTVDGLATPSRTLDLPTGVTEVLLFDLDPDSVDIGPPADWERLGDGTVLVRIEVPDGAVLELTGRARDRDLAIDLQGVEV